jgi:hypothetical protein
MPDHLQNSFLAVRSLAADDAKLGAKIFQRRRICAPGAELLDSGNEAM